MRAGTDRGQVRRSDGAASVFGPEASGALPWVEDDGGRRAAGFVGQSAGDCVCRAISIATGHDYGITYRNLNALARTERTGKRKRGKSSARTGVYKGTINRYMRLIGWTWHPTMHIGSGCTVHLAIGELPMGRLVVQVSKHLTAVIDGVIHDTHDPGRDGTRCAYGYWTPSEETP